MRPDHNAPVYDRVKGYFPVSIGTSMALEALLGLEVEENVLVRHKDSKPALGFDSLWLNLNTVYRNFVNAIERDSVPLVDPGTIFTELISEFDRIFTILKEHASHLTPLVYCCHYRDLERLFPGAKLREPRTPKQLLDNQLQERIVKHVLANARSGRLDFDIVECSQLLNINSSERVLLLTHNPTDLLVRQYTRSIELLESHSGAIKPESEWYTKYFNGKDLPNIPFMKPLLPILGDKEVFHPLGVKVKRVLLTLAQENNWTSLTTIDKVRFNISRLPDSEEKTILSSFTELRA